MNRNQINGGDLRRAGFHCNYGRCPSLPRQLAGWAIHQRGLAFWPVDILRRWGVENGHGQVISSWPVEAVQPALHHLCEFALAAAATNDRSQAERPPRKSHSDA